MLKRGLFFYGLIGLVCVLVPWQSCGEEKQSAANKINLSRRFQKKWGNRPIMVRQQLTKQTISGLLPSDQTVEKCAERFYRTLDYLPESLIRKTRLKYVTFLRKLKFNNEYAGGVASGDCIYLVVDFSEKTVFHEFFHIFDPQRHDAVWRNFNDKRFTYSGSKFYKVEMSKKQRRQVKKLNRKDDIADSFVSQYAMSFEHEDRAETFAYMIVEGRNFLKRTKNPVIKAKMEYIMDLFIKRNLLGRDFWDKHFDQKFKAKNRLYQEKKRSK